MAEIVPVLSVNRIWDSDPPIPDTWSRELDAQIGVLLSRGWSSWDTDSMVLQKLSICINSGTKAFTAHSPAVTGNPPVDPAFHLTDQVEMHRERPRTGGKTILKALFWYPIT